MRKTSQDGKFTKILVQRYENSLIYMRAMEDFFVARIFLPIARPNDIVSCVPNFSLSRSPDAAIQQNLHRADSTVKGSILS